MEESGRIENKPIEVLVLMGSRSDMNLMEKVRVPLQAANMAYEIRICSAHRAPDILADIVSDAVERGVRVIIAGAGMAAHLPGVVASITTVPVIGVPLVSLQGLGGMEALYSVVQMPPGIPVATVAINGSYNAGILAVQMVKPSRASEFRFNLKEDYKADAVDKVYY